MEVARSKGQMVRRQRLETELRKLNSDCEEEGEPQTHRERIVRQQKIVSDLERELSDAKEALRLLQPQTP